MSSLKGQLLIAAPQLQSPVFTRSVILVLEQSDDGAVGVILNRPIRTTISDFAGKIFVRDFEWDKPISLGGPLASSLLLLHTESELADAEVACGIFVSSDGAKVQELIERKVEPSLVVANYSGWGPGQLDGELRRDSWLTLPATFDHVFWSGEEELWSVAMAKARARTLSSLVGMRVLPRDPNDN